MTVKIAYTIDADPETVLVLFVENADSAGAAAEAAQWGPVLNPNGDWPIATLLFAAESRDGYNA